MRIEPFMLSGSHVVLEPLAPEHVTGLVAAATRDRTTFGFTGVPADPVGMAAYVDGLRNDALHDLVVPFAQRRVADHGVVGCTRFLSLVWRADHEVPSEVEIGGTWLATDAQRSAINTEAKLLLLGHAFDAWHVQRVAICTDERNARSRAAIERLGATFEGVLRKHRISMGEATVAGSPRHTAVYSILDDEWPTVRERLQGRLDGR